MPFRDIPVDEECPERPDAYREQVGEPCGLADLQAARQRWATDFDRALITSPRRVRHRRPPP